MAETAADEPRSETLTEGGGTALTKPERKPAPLVAHEGGVMAILPRSIEEAARYADGLIKGGLVPDSYRIDGKKDNDINPALVMMGVLKAMEIGVPPQTGLAGMYPVNNRFTVYGDLAAALVQRTGKVARQTVVWFGPAVDESEPLNNWPEDYGCEVRYWREGQQDPYIGRYSVRDAKRARLWGSTRQPWQLYPKRMLFNRARAFALRDGFADGLHGLSIAEEVIDSLPPEEAKPRVAAISSLIDEDEGAEGPQ
jgi:hypothetical protein